MLKAGLIFGGIALVLMGITGAVNFQICAPCLALFLGAGAGYVSGMFDKPLGGAGAGAKTGAAAGAVGGAGALVGHLGGGIIGALTLGPQAAAEMMRRLGIDMPTGSSSGAGYYAGAIGASCCFGLVDIALMAGLGALGGMLWYQMTGKNSGAGTPAAPAM